MSEQRKTKETLKNSKSKSSTKRKSSKEIKQKSFRNEILGIIGISIGLLFFVFLRSNSAGYIGDVVRKYIWVLNGFGGYFIPIIVTLTGVLVFSKRMDSFKRTITLFFIIFLCFLLISDMHTFGDNTSLGFVNKVKLASDSSETLQGGGMIGAILAFSFVKLFGVTCTYIVLSCIILITFLLLTKMSLAKASHLFFKNMRKFFRCIYDGLLNFIFVYEDVEIDEDEELYEEFEIDDVNNAKTEQTSMPDVQLEKSSIVSNDIDEKIKILDYTKDVPNFNLLDKKSMKKVKKEEVASDKIVVINSSNSINICDKYEKPDIELLDKCEVDTNSAHKKTILSNANKLEMTLKSFGIEAKVIQISRGPTITRYELQPAPGIKVSRIVNLSNDIALSLAASGVRIEAPIPGKAAIGIEVPNSVKDSVRIRDVIESSEFKKSDSKLSIALGKDIAGKPVIANIEKMPHMLIAGATGSGKSVCINTLIASILYKARPDEVKLILIDPKVVELSIYNGIPHLMIPVVTDPKKAASALNWAVTEMIKRYNKFAENGVRDIKSYNKKVRDLQEENMPQIVIIIDELADLMMASPAEVEDSICRLAQMARAAGLHLIVATQRPSVDVITGTIKANIPSRLSFAVSSQADSRIILDMNGAEKLLGKGDMLYYPVGIPKPIRVQCSYIDDKEVESIVEFLSRQGVQEYEQEVLNTIETNISTSIDESSDELLPKAIELVINEQQASISYIQRKLRVGYARAARIVDEMEERGIVGGHEGSKPRKVLVSKEEYANSDV